LMVVGQLIKSFQFKVTKNLWNERSVSFLEVFRF
jgi:hypothetical protein